MKFSFKNLPKLQTYSDKTATTVISYRIQEPTNVIRETPTLVFLHGFNGSSKSWYFQFNDFKSYRIISIDAPGFGASSVCEGGMSEFADKLINFLKDMGQESVILIGHSMGGMLAQILASKLAEKCRGLVLSCTHKGRAQPKNVSLSGDIQKRMEQRLSLNDEDFGTLRINRMLSGPLPDDIRAFLIAIASEIRPNGIKWGGAAMQYLDTSAYLNGLTMPVLIISAADDIVVKPEALDALLSSLPSAQHEKMADVGHAPYCENSDGFNQILERFIISCANV